MIKIQFELECDVFLSYLSQGHADHPEVALCNGLSALEYQFFYSIKTLCPNLKSTSKFDKGHFEIHFDKLSSPNPVFKTLSQSLLIGLEMLKNQYPDSIQIIQSTRRKND